MGYLIQGTAGSYQVPTNSNTFTAASVTQGTLPAGLTLSGSGLISGTPAAGTQGTSSLTINVTPAVGSAYDQDLTLTILANQFVDPSPSTGNGFGTAMLVLSNGNVVVTAPYDDAGGTDAGAVYLFQGSTGALISTLRGSTAGDNVGLGGITALTDNGNYVVQSNGWDNGTITDAGAVTWGSGTAGVTGVVSSANSLVGSTASDQVGSTGVTALSNGNYVVRSQSWDNGTITDAGAVTWGSGTAGVTGVVSSANSLVGSTAIDNVGNTGVTALSNGNYVVQSQNWDNGTITNAGAVTWGNGTAGVSGVVSGLNSLVGPFLSMTPTINTVTNTFLMAKTTPSILASGSLLSPSATTASSSANPVTSGASVTFTATVTAGATGTVQFYDGGVALGSAVTLSGNTATYATSALSAGEHSITATYSGDASYAPSTSAAFSQVVNVAPTVTTQPVGGTYLPGAITTLTAAATGVPTPSVQWQLNTGSGWSDVAGATTTSLGVVVSPGMRPQQYRAVFTNAVGTTTSDPANVMAAVDVTSQVVAVRSGLVLNRTTGLFEGTIKLTNTGASLAAFSMLLSSLTAGVTLVNDSGKVTSGTQYLNTGPLAAGQSITLRLSFRKPLATTPVNYLSQFFLMP